MLNKLNSMSKKDVFNEKNIALNVDNLKIILSFGGDLPANLLEREKKFRGVAFELLSRFLVSASMNNNDETLKEKLNTSIFKDGSFEDYVSNMIKPIFKIDNTDRKIKHIFNVEEKMLEIEDLCCLWLESQDEKDVLTFKIIGVLFEVLVAGFVNDNLIIHNLDEEDLCDQVCFEMEDFL